MEIILLIISVILSIAFFVTIGFLAENDDDNSVLFLICSICGFMFLVIAMGCISDMSENTGAEDALIHHAYKIEVTGSYQNGKFIPKDSTVVKL